MQRSDDENSDGTVQTRESAQVSRGQSQKREGLGRRCTIRWWVEARKGRGNLSFLIFHKDSHIIAGKRKNFANLGLRRTGREQKHEGWNGNAHTN